MTEAAGGSAGHDVAGASYVATVKPDRVECRPRTGGEATAPWTAQESHASPGPYKETCRTAFFVGSNPRALVLIIDFSSVSGLVAEKVLLVDPATSNRRELISGSESRTVEIQQAFAFAEVF